MACSIRRVRQRERSNLPGEHRARNSVGYFQGADRQRVRADTSAAGSQWPCSKRLNFLRYRTGQKSLGEDGVYYLEEKLEGGALAVLSSNPADQLGDLAGVTVLHCLTS